MIVIDPAQASGRIAALHGTTGRSDRLLEAVSRVAGLDPRIRSVVLDTERLRATSRKWFVRGDPVRCQIGTPIFAFVQAIEEAAGEFVLRVDCDMLFSGARWVDAAQAMLVAGEADIVEPARLGADSTAALPPSSRAFVVFRQELVRRVLPLRASTLDFPRRLHRWLQGRPPWLALEQTFDDERRRGRLRHCVLPADLGFSLHVPKRSDFERPDIQVVVRRIERGDVPEFQRDKFDLVPGNWGL